MNVRFKKPKLIKNKNDDIDRSNNEMSSRISKDYKYDERSDKSDELIFKQESSIKEMEDIMRSYNLEDKIEEAINTSGKLTKKNYNIDDMDAEKVEQNNSSNEDEDDACEELKLSINDFHFIINLGSGGYGKVDLVKKRKTGDKYALKTIDMANNVRFF